MQKRAGNCNPGLSGNAGAWGAEIHIFCYYGPKYSKLGKKYNINHLHTPLYDWGIIQQDTLKYGIPSLNPSTP